MDDADDEWLLNVDEPKAILHMNDEQFPDELFLKINF